MSLKISNETKEGEIKLTADNLDRFSKTELSSIAKKLNVDHAQKDSKGKLIQLLNGITVKKDDLEDPWIKLLETEPDVETVTVKKEVVVGKKVTISGVKIELKPDEEVLDHKVYDNRIVCVIQGARSVYKKEFKK